MITLKPLKISQSRIKLWRRCRYAHHLRYNLNIDKKKASLPLVRGKIIHEMIEARINDQSWKPILLKHTKEYNKMFSEEKAEFGDLPTELLRMMKGYERKYQNDTLEYLEKDGKRAEFLFEIEIAHNIVFEGLIDTVPMDENGRVWVMEHKTHKAIPSESARFTDLQTTFYCWVLPQIGFPKPTGVLWDYIRTKTPTIPEMLKKGGLSKKQIDTNFETYFHAILKNGLNPYDYIDMLVKLKSRPDGFYRRIFFPAPVTIMKPLVDDLIETAKEIQVLGEFSKSRNITKDCSWCSYYSLCQAELRGLDSEFILKTEFKARDKRDRKEVKNIDAEEKDSD